MNRGLIVLQIGVVLMTTVGPALNAYDFMERPAAILLGEATEELTVGSGGFAQTAYHANVFRDAPTDRFQVATLAAHGIVRRGPVSGERALRDAYAQRRRERGG
jgi:hypothetical protein